jgi:GH15 family glucan-1,4-alpha-glucosidase
MSQNTQNADKPRWPDTPYPRIEDYAFISDCHCGALISRDGSIDWCCMPRFDDDSSFGRLVDWEKGGHCSIAPTVQYVSSRRYLPGTLVLETWFRTDEGEVKLIDFFAMDEGELPVPRLDLIRIIEGVSGEVELRLEFCPRFDYGEVIPYIRKRDSGAYVAIGGDQGLLVASEVELDCSESGMLQATWRVAAGQRQRLLIQFEYPEDIEDAAAKPLPDSKDLDDRCERTVEWWKKWSGQMRAPFEADAQTLASALLLKGLTFEKTGAVIAAATTSLPEWIGGERNWDYRYSWVRDSVFTVRVLHALGFIGEADRFHRFIQRSSAGSADQLQIMYGIDGKRRLPEIRLDWLEGYRQSRPVRIGNAAAKQMQLDIYGELLEMAWAWHVNGHDTEPEYWRFLCDVIDTVAKRWEKKDRGIWEVRCDEAHHVHSKVMCWAAVNRAIQIAEDDRFQAPVGKWMALRDQMREVIEEKGYDHQRGIFTQSFGSPHLDAALLLMPRVDFIPYTDPRMMRTTAAICEELDHDGLLLRYKSPDGLKHPEGVFLPCTFWLVECLAHQGRLDQAWKYYERAMACANDVGLFSEEFDVENQHMLGNVPQGLTHVSQITARLALAEAEKAMKQG